MAHGNASRPFEGRGCTAIPIAPPHAHAAAKRAARLGAAAARLKPTPLDLKEGEGGEAERNAGPDRSNRPMLLLAFHIVTVGMLILAVGMIAYRVGLREGEKRARTLIEESRQGG